MRIKIINDIADKYLVVLKREGKFFDLDRSRFKYLDL